jgi:CRP-like cAMP-binding protein
VKSLLLVPLAVFYRRQQRGGQLPHNQNRNTDPGNRVSSADAQDLDPQSKGARSNAILNALSESRLAQLLPKLKSVELELGRVLYEPEQSIDYVYFPTAGIISLLAAFQDGATAEAGVIGTEGMLGTPVVLGAETTPHQALVQVSGHAMRMAARDLTAEVENDGSLLKSMLRYTNAMFIQVAQTAACNGLHTIEQRLARCLLLTHDRVRGDEFVLTQEFLSRMLGVRRAGVSVAANNLKQSGMIDYRRGNVTVLDRKGVEHTSCECYEAVKQEYDRYLKN